MTCPLCLCDQIQLFEQDKFRSYLRCSSCSLVFVPRPEMISVDEERNRYDSHNNSEEDPHYQSYLAGIVESIVPFLPESSVGLDFGCGRTQLLEKLLKQRGYATDSLDIFFHPRADLLEKKFDFIILSEVIEHLRNPNEELHKLRSLLNPAGIIFIKTKLLPVTKEAFSNWFYKRDSTHVQFFCEETFKLMEKLFKLEGAKQIGKDLFYFRCN